MSNFALRVQGVGKEYQIAKVRQHETFVEQISSFVTGPIRRASKLLQGQQTGAAELDDTFWALA